MAWSCRSLATDEKQRFIKNVPNQYKVVLGKELFADVMRHKYFSDSDTERTRDARLEQVAKVEAVSEAWSIAQIASELDQIVEQAREGLRKYPPYENYVEKSKDHYDSMLWGFEDMMSDAYGLHFAALTQRLISTRIRRQGWTFSVFGPHVSLECISSHWQKTPERLFRKRVAAWLDATLGKEEYMLVPREKLLPEGTARPILYMLRF